MTCMIYLSTETTVCMDTMIYKHQERLTYVELSYLAVFCEAVVPTNDNSSLLWIASKCMTVPFESTSSLLEST